MKQQTFYISDDNFYFKDLNECVEYENEFYIKLKQAEEKYLGKRLKHVYCEPCLDTIKHDKNKLLELVTILCACIENNLNKDDDENKNIYHNIAEIRKSLNEINNDNNCDIIKNWRHIVNLLWKYRNYCLKYNSVDRYGYLYMCDTIFNKIAERLYNTSIVTGIEYPDSYYVYNEDKWEEYKKHELEYIKAGGKYR